ncbi:MAG: hypothetical protein PHN60_02135 [Candidatus Gracilibacteria bacterium]|nr:hypothetical protein [Candidatus Gracilibacteria bacterium]
MKSLSFWKKSVYSGLVFFGTVVVLTVGYAVWNSPYVMSTVGSGSGLTANGWNALVNNIDDLNSRLSNLSFSGGNVGVGTTSPGTRLDTHIQTTQNIAGTVANSYPIASFLNESSASSGIRGLEIGAPTSGIVSPVYLKISGTSSRFSLLNQSNVENLTVLDNGNVGIGNPNPGAKLDVVGELRVNGAVYKTQNLVLPANTTKTLKVDIAGSYGFYEIKVAGYVSSGGGSCLIAWTDGGHGGGTIYHQLQETARITQGNPVLGAITKTPSGGSISLQNTSITTPLVLLITVISNNSLGETSFAVLE